MTRDEVDALIERAKPFCAKATIEMNKTVYTFSKIGPRSCVSEGGGAEVCKIDAILTAFGKRTIKMPLSKLMQVLDGKAK